MKIIAIIVTYNGMKWYKKCFNSLIESTIPVQTIIIDNNSTDDSVQFIKENYPQFKLIESNLNLGFGKANNIGLKYAIQEDADFVFLLNQDAWVKTNTLEGLVDKIKESPNFGIVSPIHLSGSEDNLDPHFSTYIQSDSCPNLLSDFVIKGNAEDRIYPVKFVNAALWLISKQCIYDVGGFDPIFPHYGEDDNYIGRIQYHGYEIGIYPKVFGVHDREIKKKSEQTFSQRKGRELIRYIIILTGLYSSYKTLLFRSFFYISLEMYSNLLHLSFGNFIINVSSFFNIIRLTPKILKNRKISRTKDLSFLK